VKGLGSLGPRRSTFSVAGPGCLVLRIWIQFGELRSEIACNSGLA